MTATVSPACFSRRAAVTPVIPPPTMATSTAVLPPIGLKGARGSGLALASDQIEFRWLGMRGLPCFLLCPTWGPRRVCRGRRIISVAARPRRCRLVPYLRSVVTFLMRVSPALERTTKNMKDTAKSPEQLRKKRQVRRQTQGTSGSRSRSRSDDGRAFFPDPEDGPARAPDDLAEQMAEDFLKAATSGEDQDDDLLDATVSEEIGGPFVITSARQELAAGTD